MTGKMTDEEMMVQYKSHITYLDAKIAQLEAEKEVMRRICNYYGYTDTMIDALKEAT